MSSTLRTHLGIHSTLVSHLCQSLVRPTCNRQVVNLPARLVISLLPSWHVQTLVGVKFMTAPPITEPRCVMLQFEATPPWISFHTSAAATIHSAADTFHELGSGKLGCKFALAVPGDTPSFPLPVVPEGVTTMAWVGSLQGFQQLQPRKYISSCL